MIHVATFGSDFSDISQTVSEMRKLIGLIVIVVLSAAWIGETNAQGTGLFSGNGFRDGSGTRQANNSNSSTSPFGFYRGEKAPADEPSTGFQFPKLELPEIKLPKFEMPKFLKADNFPNPIQLSDTPSKNLFSGWPKLDLANRDPNQPNFFERMNERTKQLFGNTRDNINNLTRTNPLGLDRSATEKWSNVTRGLNGDIGGSGNRNPPPVQPQNLRSARTPEGSTSRF